MKAYSCYRQDSGYRKRWSSAGHSDLWSLWISVKGTKDGVSESLEETRFYFSFCSLEGNGFYRVVFISAVQQSELAVCCVGPFPPEPAEHGAASWVPAPCSAAAARDPSALHGGVYRQGHSRLSHPLLPSPHVQTSVSISVSVEEILNNCFGFWWWKELCVLGWLFTVCFEYLSKIIIFSKMFMWI